MMRLRIKVWFMRKANLLHVVWGREEKPCEVNPTIIPIKVPKVNLKSTIKWWRMKILLYSILNFQKSVVLFENLFFDMGLTMKNLIDFTQWMITVVVTIYCDQILNQECTLTFQQYNLKARPLRVFHLRTQAWIPRPPTTGGRSRLRHEARPRSRGSDSPLRR